MADNRHIGLVKANVGRMLGMNAPEADIDGYIAEEGVTAEQLRAYQAAPRPETLQEASLFDPNIVERGAILPLGLTSEGEREWAVPGMIKDVVEGAMIPGHLLGGGAVTQEEMQRGAMATVPSGRGLIGGVKPKMRPRTAEEIKADASKLYKAVEGSPTIVSPRSSLELLTGLEAKLNAEAVTPKGYPKVWSVLRDMKRYKGSEMPMKRLMAHLRVLNKDVNPDEARVAGIASDYIKQYLVTHGDDRVQGDLGMLKQADTLWAKGSTVKTFENAIEKAKHESSGFENGLRQQFRGILKKEIDGKIYLPADVKRAVESVVDGTIPANALKRIGKFGPGLGQQTNGLMAMLLAMSGGGAAIAGNPGVAAAVAGLAATGQAAQMGARAATRKAASGALGAQAGRVPTGQHAIMPSAPMIAAPKVLGTQINEGPQGLLYDEYGPLL